MQNLKVIKRVLSSSINPALNSEAANIDSLTSTKRDTYEYLKTGFTAAQQWYVKYGTMTSSKLYFEMFKYLDLKSANIVFEVGSGPGNGIELMVSEVSPDCKIIASDINQPFLNLIKEKNFKNVEIMEANFEDLPLQDKSIDRHISNMAIHNAKDSLTPLKEAHRALSNGGIMGATVFGAKTNTYIQLNSKFRNFTGMPYHASLLKNLENMGNIEPFQDLAYKAGFKEAFAFGVNTDYPFKTAEEALDLFLTFDPYIMWMEQNPDRAQEFKDLVYNECRNCLEVEGKPIGYEGVILIAKKDN